MSNDEGASNCRNSCCALCKVSIIIIIIIIFTIIIVIIIIVIIIIIIIIILYLRLRYMEKFLGYYPLFSFIKIRSVDLELYIQAGRQAEGRDFASCLCFGKFYCDYAKERNCVTSHNVSINFLRDAIKRCLF